MITANDEVTVFAMKNTFSKFQVLKMSAVGAFARCTFPAVDFANGLPAFESDPFQYIHEAGEAEVGNFAAPKRFHAVDIQVLEAHDIVFIAQVMCQLKMMVKPFVGNIRIVLRKISLRSFISMRPFPLARKFSVQLAGLVDILREKLRAGIACVFVVNEECLETKIESAAFTRAGFSNDDLLEYSKHKPQPTHAVTLDHQCLDLPHYLPMQNKLIFHAIHRDRIAIQFVSRLWEAERGIFDCLSKLWTTLCQSLEETHVCIIHPQHNILTDLRMQTHPKRKSIRPSQFQNMFPHLVQRYIFPTQVVVASLQSDEVIPNRGSNI